MQKISPVLRHLNIPNLITTLGMAFGIVAAYHLTLRNLRMAIVFLFIAGCMDLFDGFVASKLNQQSEFGRYLDTLVDFFTCVIMPIWMVFDLFERNYMLFAALVFYCICGLWRLANYSLVGAGKTFTGLPVPASMGLVTMTVWFVTKYDLPVIIGIVAFFVVGALMVSGIKLPKYGLWQKAFGLLGLGFVIYVLLLG